MRKRRPRGDSVVQRQSHAMPLLGVLDDELREIHGQDGEKLPDIKSFNRQAHRCAPRAALCLSGGGVRSAAFALGVVQWLAEHKLLNQFHYLSTVSGGGYIGSWLSAWLHNGPGGYDRVREQLATRSGDGRESPVITRLRENSQYLTPKSGALSGDTWTAIAIFIGNLILNWLVLVPFIAALCLLPQIAAAIIAASHGGSIVRSSEVGAIVLYGVMISFIALTAARTSVLNGGRRAFVAFCLAPGVGAALLWTLHSASSQPSNVAPTRSLFDLIGTLSLLHAGAALLGFAAYRGLGWFYPRIWVKSGELVRCSKAAADQGHPLDSKPPARDLMRFTVRLSRRSADTTLRVRIRTDDRRAVDTIHYQGIDQQLVFPPNEDRLTVDVPLLTTEIDGRAIDENDLKLRIYKTDPRVSVGPTPRPSLIGKDFIASLAAGVVVACCLFVMQSVLSAWYGDPEALRDGPAHSFRVLVFTCFALPATVLAILAGQLVSVAATSWLPRSDEDREWLGRASGGFLLTGLVWLGLAGTVLLVPLLPFKVCSEPRLRKRFLQYSQ